jgi:hypothetical protein
MKEYSVQRVIALNKRCWTTHCQTKNPQGSSAHKHQDDKIPLPKEHTAPTSTVRTKQRCVDIQSHRSLHPWHRAAAIPKQQYLLLACLGDVAYFSDLPQPCQNGLTAFPICTSAVPLAMQPTTHHQTGCWASCCPTTRSYRYAMPLLGCERSRS